MKNRIHQIILILREQTKQFNLPLIDIIIKEYGKDPFLILIGCLLSLRAKDVVTIHVFRNLRKKCKTPQELLAINPTELERIIYKSGFYKTKAQTLRNVCNTLIQKYNGHVPRTKQELLAIKGVGIKTANLVLGMAFDIPAICVDTHVHRISNRLGIIKTKTPQHTEKALEKVLDPADWIHWNTYLVMWGQNVCLPRHPKCDRCPLKTRCMQVGLMPTKSAKPA